MRIAEWLKGFRDLHEKAKRGALGSREMADYQEARNELARALLSAQHVSLQPGQKPRHALRVARALQVNLEFFDGPVRGITRQVSPGGFSVLLARPPKVDEEVAVSVRVPGGEPLSAQARVVEVKPLPGNAQVSFQFVGLGPDALERLETFVFDAVLEQIQR